MCTNRALVRADKLRHAVSDNSPSDDIRSSNRSPLMISVKQREMFGLWRPFNN